MHIGQILGIFHEMCMFVRMYNGNAYRYVHKYKKKTDVVTKRTEVMSGRETADKAKFGVNDRSKMLARSTGCNERPNDVENS